MRYCYPKLSLILLNHKLDCEINQSVSDINFWALLPSAIPCNYSRVSLRIRTEESTSILIED